MADAKIVNCNPDEPNTNYLLLMVDSTVSTEETIVSKLGMSAYEGENCFYLSQTDAFLERAYNDKRLVLNIFIHERLIEEMNIRSYVTHNTLSNQHSAICILSVKTAINIAEADGLDEVTLMTTGTNFEDSVAKLLSGQDFPVIFAPPP